MPETALDLCFVFAYIILVSAKNVDTNGFETELFDRVASISKPIYQDDRLEKVKLSVHIYSSLDL